jgi:hypothetical protein
MQKYYRREFEAAMLSFERMSAEDAEDAVPVLFAERCARYMRFPPPPDWQGIEILSSK